MLTFMKSKQFNIVFIVVLLLLTLNLVYWGTQKEGYHGDELYSYQFISRVDKPSINSSIDGVNYLYNWHDADYYRDYLTVSSDEAYDMAGVYQSIKDDVHPPIFYMLLELSCSLFSQNKFVKWSGVGLNILFFVMTMIVLFRLSRKFMKSKWWALLVCAAYGFSIGAVNTVLFIRMYMILTFASVLFVYIHALFWEKMFHANVPGKQRLILYAILYATSVFGILTQYYFLVFAFFVCIIFWLYLLVRKNFRYAIEYACTMGMSIVTSLLIWPETYTDMFSGYRGKEALANFGSLTNLKGLLKTFIGIANRELLAGFGIGVFLLLILLMILCILKARYRIEKLEFENSSLYFQVVKNDEKKQRGVVRVSIEWFLFLQLVVVVGFNFLIIANIAPYQVDRYIFNLYPLIMLGIVFLLNKLTNKLKWKHFAKGVIVFVFMFFIFCGYKTVGVGFLYRGTADKINTIESYSDTPAVLVTHDNRRYVSCVNSIFLEKSQAIYPIEEDGIDRVPDALEELESTEVIIYIDKNVSDMEDILNQLQNVLNTEQVQYLFNTNESSVYVIKL